MKIAIVDYGMGNLHSVFKAVRYAAEMGSIDLYFATSAEQVMNADRIIFPGQGSAPDCMREIESTYLDKALIQGINDGKPFIGICVGAQLLLDSSEEGGTETLGIISGEVMRFSNSPKIKVPHMGWNRVYKNIDHPLMHGIDDGEYFYFLHSYYLRPAHLEDEVATTFYGDVDFCCCVARGNVFAVQFHPEKSHDQGIAILKNFLVWKI